MAKKNAAKKKFSLRKLLIVGVLIGAAIAVKKALSDPGGSYVPPTARQ